MKLSRLALLAIKGCGKDFKKKLADAMGVNVQTAYRWIQDENDNLTKAAAMKVIREETGLSDAEILEIENQVA